jgi:opacity protein-like surface antigen
LAWILLLAAAPALANDADADALSLADKTPATVERAGDWHVFVEGAAGASMLRDGASVGNQRLSIDIQYDKSFAPGWRAVFADRLDLNWQDDPSRQNGINSLKEAYLSWQTGTSQLFDAGRINARNGVALGYNPTDYFRSGASRSIVSADPASQKQNRLGSAMLRSQTLWDGGSLTALYSPKIAPKIADHPNDAPFNPDWGSTNNQNRWLLAVSQELSEGISPQWLLYGEQRQSVQLGFNLTKLLNDATVSYIEWSGGRNPSLLTRALSGADDSVFRNRVATGLTYTTSNKMSLTLEYQYNGAGLRKTEWDALARTSLLDYGQYRRFVQSEQDMPTRQAVFFFGTWQDAMINRLDLSAMLRFNIDDRSRLSWLEARYRWDRAEAALQWQFNGGHAASEFGASPQQRIVQAVARVFF